MLKEKLSVHLYEVFTRPILVGIIMATLWWFFMWQDGKGIHAAVEGSRSSDAFNNFMIFHSLVAGGLFIKLLTDCDKIQRAVRTNDEKAFRLEIQLRLPMVAKLFLIGMSCLIQSTALYMYYPNVVEGLQLNAAIGFILMFFWELARVLDSPMGTIWSKDSVPAHWLTAEPETS